MRNSVIWFFVLVYVLSAPFWIIELFITKTNLPLNIPVTDIIAAFVPLISACILTFNEKGKKGVILLLSRIFDYGKINAKWWVIVLILPFLVFSIIYSILRLGSFQIPEHWSLSYMSIPFLLIFFFFGAIGEEVGYMGYAVDPLQKKFNSLVTAILIGIPWIVWHYPSMLKQGHSLNFFFWGSLGTIAFRVIYVWLYNNTNKSLFACILVHCLYNTGRVIFLSDQYNNPLVDFPNIHYGVLVLIAITITLLWGHKTLTNFMGQNRIENASC